MPHEGGAPPNVAGTGAVRVSVEVNVSLSALMGQLTDIERKVLVRWRSKTLTFVRTAWTGWVYKGRPAGAPRNVSFKAWKSTVDAQGERPALVLVNAATDYRTKKDHYAAYVHRVGATIPEWERVVAGIRADILPKLTADLTKEIAASLSPTRRKRGTRATHRGGEVVGTEMVL